MNVNVTLMERNASRTNGGITISVDVNVKKKQYICEKDYVWNSATCNCDNGKYLASSIDDSMITCPEVMKSCEEEIKTIPTNFNENKVTYKTQSFYILLALLLINIALLIAVSIYC